MIGDLHDGQRMFEFGNRVDLDLSTAIHLRRHCGRGDEIIRRRNGR